MRNELSIAQSQEYEGADWWKWSVWLEGESETLDDVEYVEWTLHPTFPNPIRKVRDRNSKFRLDTAGWGVFPILARVQMKGGSQLKLRHELRLTYPDGGDIDE